MQIVAVITVIASLNGVDVSKVIEQPTIDSESCANNKSHVVLMISNDLKAAISDFKIDYQCEVRI